MHTYAFIITILQIHTYGELCIQRTRDNTMLLAHVAFSQGGLIGGVHVYR